MIYMAYNTVNGKYYVGQTLNLAKRKSAHKMKAGLGVPGLLNDAICEHGFDAFEWFVLSGEAGKNEMNRREHELIVALKANDPRCGYNTNLPRYNVTDEEAGQAVIRAFELVSQVAA